MKNVFRTENCNHYLYHASENKVMYLHPLVNFFYELEEHGTHAEEWLAGVQKEDEPHIDIKGLGVFTKKELFFCFKKYRLLKERNYFCTVTDKSQFQRRLTGYDIENLIASSTDIIFEITKSCNLDCRYCIQGDFYDYHEKDQEVNINLDYAKRLLNYLSRYWNHPLSPKHNAIKFYGGEPLLQIEAVKEIVAHVKSFTDYREKFLFKVTTNGVLLDRHMDYLVANNFYIAISLDGDENSNRHRVLANGKPAFKKITANIDLLREKHPRFFEENVSFQSVLHNLNSITKIAEYFQETYRKCPQMTEMVRVGVKRERKNEYDMIRKGIYDSLYHGEDYPLLNTKKLTDLPKTPGSGIITHNIYNWLLKNRNETGESVRNMTPTGTCHPFSRGIFLATDGRILPCERIEHRFAFGKVDEEVRLDFNDIAERFNRYCDKMKQLCLSCSYARSCQKCMFNCKVDESRPDCNLYCGQKDFLEELSDNIGYLEDRPEIYFKNISEV